MGGISFFPQERIKSLHESAKGGHFNVFKNNERPVFKDIWLIDYAYKMHFLMK